MTQYCSNCGAKNEIEKFSPHKKCKKCGQYISFVPYYSAPIPSPNPPGEDEPANQEEP